MSRNNVFAILNTALKKKKKNGTVVWLYFNKFLLDMRDVLKKSNKLRIYLEYNTKLKIIEKS